ncbi:Diphthine synthase [uncultured archaeon]|nr:Diphthine synthase [uncultured archaeon]
MGLVLVGTGLWDETDISLRGLSALKKCARVYAEQYTCETRPGTLSRLEKLCGKSISLLAREEVEDGKRLLSEAAGRDVALVVAGDPMISTTHVSLKLDAFRKKIPFKVIHSSSILSAAISESGLHTYKFGKPVTLPFWSENYKPTSTYDALQENRERGLHTILFLDLKGGKTMTAAEAFSLLRKIEGERRKGAVSSGMKLLVLSRVGASDMKLSFGTLGKLEGKIRLLGKSPFMIIVPGKLHFTEEDALALYAVK